VAGTRGARDLEGLRWLARLAAGVAGLAAGARAYAGGHGPLAATLAAVAGFALAYALLLAAIRGFARLLERAGGDEPPAATPTDVGDAPPSELPRLTRSRRRDGRTRRLMGAQDPPVGHEPEER
jgi:hypothetical protein